MISITMTAHKFTSTQKKHNTMTSVKFPHHPTLIDYAATFLPQCLTLVSFCLASLSAASRSADSFSEAAFSSANIYKIKIQQNLIEHT